ncbi:MAG: TraX family protein [Bacilli bacterium]
MKKNFTFLSSFIIRILAFLFMTIDHIGYLMEMYYSSSQILEIANVFRIIGRFALPLFIFLIVEGFFHTKNVKKYFYRLLGMALIISIGEMFALYVMEMNLSEGNIFIDLTLCLLMIWALDNKKIYIKLLAILPIAYSILCGVSYCLEFGNNINVIFLPDYIRMQYYWYSILLCLGFYFAKKLTRFMFSTFYPSTKDEKDLSKYDKNYQIYENLISITFLVAVNLIHYFIYKNIPQRFVFVDYEVQLYAMMSGIFILLYNGKGGYSSKVTKIINYLYYPVHLLVLYGIFMLINL